MMKVKSYITNQEWLAERPAVVEGDEPAAGEKADPALEEVARVLSDVVRSKNLIVLTGLGTSLCIKDGENTKAPTMPALWIAVRDAYAQPALDRASWDEILAITRHPEGNTDIEELLSRSKISESFESDENIQNIRRFINDAEKIIREKVDFLEPNEELPVHESFLRRLARRSVRRDRLKLFTTNYDRCFEHAALRAGFVIIDGFTLTQPSWFLPPPSFNRHLANTRRRPRTAVRGPRAAVHGSRPAALDARSAQLTLSGRLRGLGEPNDRPPTALARHRH